MKENDPSSVLLFLVGTKKDLSVGETSLKSRFSCLFVCLFVNAAA